MRKFIHRDINGIVDTIRIIYEDGRVKFINVYTEILEELLNKYHIDRLPKKFKYKNCKGKVFYTFNTSLDEMHWDNVLDYIKQLKKRHFKKVK